MSIFEAVRLAWAQIRAQKLKSFFTLLGVTIGVTFLIAVVSIVGGMSRYMQDDLIGKLIAVNAFELRSRPNIQMGDVDAETQRSYRRRQRIRQEDVPVVVAALPAGTRWAQMSENTVRMESRYASPRNINAYGVSEDYFGIKKMDVTTGRLIAQQEYALGAPVVVIGLDVAEHFFPGLDAVGREIRISGIPYQVIGVAESQGSAFGLSFDRFVVAPYSAPLSRVLNVHGVIDAVIVQGESPIIMIEAQERVRQAMRILHQLRPAEADDFALQTADSALEFWNKIKSYMVLAGVALPAIGLVVGAIVIMNIMLVAVAERTREIGIRKSLGARRRDILRQFIVESATLSTFGAALGVAIGLGLAQLIAAVSPLPAVVELWSIIVGVSVGAGVGIIAGVYPARQASLLDPVAAMRQET